MVIDIAGELCSRRGITFTDYTEAVRNLSAYTELPATVIQELEPLPGFRNVLIHDYIRFDLHRVIDALDRLDSVDEFAAFVRGIAARAEKNH